MDNQLEAVCVLGIHRSRFNLGEESQLIAKGEKFNLAGYWKHGGITLRQQQILKKFSY